MADRQGARGPSRRDVLIGAAGLAGGAGIASAGILLGAHRVDTRDDDAAGLASAPVDPHGANQAGVARPATPQGHGLLQAVDLPADAQLGFLRAVGERITALVGDDSELLTPLPLDLTITIGIGPRLIRTIDEELSGAEDLPAFAGDDAIDAHRLGGDVLVAAYASDPGVLGLAVSSVIATIPGATLRWSQHVFRAAGEGFVTRNPLGFHDGIVVPKSKDELDANVWLDSGPLAGATVCVIRGLRLDVAGFTGLPVSKREGVIGRRAGDGAPLSGGGANAEVDLRAKTANGEYLTPAHSHARAAHPSFTGSELMLRRGYAFDNGLVHADRTIADTGLMFICFQRSLRTFIATQQRLDEMDDLMPFTTPTLSATFLILPGFDRTNPLGAALGL